MDAKKKEQVSWDWRDNAKQLIENPEAAVQAFGYEWLTMVAEAALAQPAQGEVVQAFRHKETHEIKYVIHSMEHNEDDWEDVYITPHPPADTIAVPRSEWDGWISVDDGLPEVKIGDMDFFIVCRRDSKTGKQYVFEAALLNEYELEDSDTGEPMARSGWHHSKEHVNYDDYYMPIDDPSEITHWCHHPAPPVAKSTGEDV